MTSLIINSISSTLITETSKQKLRSQMDQPSPSTGVLPGLITTAGVGRMVMNTDLHPAAKAAIAAAAGLGAYGLARKKGVGLYMI